MFTKRYIVERTSKAEIRPEEQSKTAESCRENLCNEIQVKGPQRPTAGKQIAVSVEPVTATEATVVLSVQGGGAGVTITNQLPNL